MKSVLILCHDFPPLNTVASHRPLSWYNYLSDFSFKPIVVCRKWKANIVNQEDKFQAVNDEIDVAITNDKELHRIPVLQSHRDNFIRKHGLNKRSTQRKMHSFISQVKAFLNPSKGEYYYLYSYCHSYLKKQHVDVIIATGGPFDLFKYASKLSSEFNIPWVADYRDEWQGNISLKDTSSGRKIVRNYLRGNEKTWTKNCHCFTSVSLPLIERISKRINKKGYLVRNGLDLANIPSIQKVNNNRFVLSYAGTIYNTQYVETFTKGLILFIEKEKPSKDEFNLQLIGIQLNFTEGTNRLLKLLRPYEKYVSILPSMPQTDLMTELSNSTAFLNMVYGNIAMGIYAVKIFDYMALGKPIINVEEVRPESEHEFSAYMKDCYTPEDICAVLSDLFNKWKNGENLHQELPKHILDEFDRKHQCGKLVEVLNQAL